MNTNEYWLASLLSPLCDLLRCVQLDPFCSWCMTLRKYKNTYKWNRKSWEKRHRVSGFTYIFPVNFDYFFMSHEAAVGHRTLQKSIWWIQVKMCKMISDNNIKQIKPVTLTCWDICSSYFSWFLKPLSQESQKNENSGSFLFFCSRFKREDRHVTLFMTATQNEVKIIINVVSIQQKVTLFPWLLG